MTPEQIESVLHMRFERVELGEEQRWVAEVESMQVVVVADGDNDRLRVMVPIAAVDEPDADTFQRLLEANFTTSQDARYAIYNRILWSLYVGPLSAAVEHQFDAILTQVIELAKTTGTTYSAGPRPMGGGLLHVH